MKLIDTTEQLENLDISSPKFDTRKNVNIKNNNKNLEAIQKKIDELRNKIYYAKQAADAVIYLQSFFGRIHALIILDQRRDEYIQLPYVLPVAANGGIPEPFDYL